MGKRKPAFDLGQMSLALGVPETVSSDGALAMLRRQTASAVGAILKGEPRNRFEVAGAVSALTDDEVTKLMLDAYASEAREAHAISFDRMLALVAATGRYDVLKGLLRTIGCDLLVGEEAFLARVGDLEARKRGIEAELKRLKAVIEPREQGEHRK
ncbi:hypothetical protein GVN21_16705 [Caulobacter sp. SLTY]|uniref:hypothetical protein n=1 Tax=Caulobacter sp. SLTY TaxID=2683262 RepID=UPI001413017C|nr:hypothetical protein [Caulobacter sp. SLTY]NBB17008.1 hypothetical protein [Caulobacter sp. SLTY]